MENITSILLTNLPQHVIIKIFEFLSTKNLLIMSLICKDFNNIISTTRKLMKKFKVIFNHTNTDEKWLVRKKFSNFIVSTGGFDKFISLLPKIGKNVESLEIYENSKVKKFLKRKENMTITKFKELLKMTPNLKFLDTKLQIRRQNNEKLGKYQKLFLNLDTLEGEMNFQILSIFYECQVKKLNLLVKTDESEFNAYQINVNSRNFVEFIMKQKNLEELAGRINDVSFFQSDHLLKTKFKLKVLSVYLSSRDKIQTVTKFLKLHQNSLEKLTIVNGRQEYFEILHKFKNLKSLMTSVNPREKYFFEPVESVTELMVMSYCTENFAEYFPNVETFKVLCPKAPFEIESFEKIETLVVYLQIDAKITNTCAAKLITINSILKPHDLEDHEFDEITCCFSPGNSYYTEQFEKYKDDLDIEFEKIIESDCDKFVAYFNDSDDEDYSGEENSNEEESENEESSKDEENESTDLTENN